ncbi:MAG: tRNA dihydrouridine synthase DusB [Proteobacteria bacterium]|nr:tRNA dihydrouridine synthase DusB [Pseudomonadota bacterium]
MAIHIGPVRLDNPVILAPMSGVTDQPFRRLVKRSGAALVISEMIASQAAIRETRQSLKMSTNCAEEFPMAVQLAGCDPSVMSEAAKLNVDRGAAIIDINMGCPVKKVVNKEAGSALMRQEALAGRILEAVVKAVPLPVTLKIRTGWDDSSRNAPEIARIAEASGIQAITVHGRTRCQFYTGTSDWDFIRKVKEAVKIPVIGNGDVTSPEEAKRMLELSGADGVMIGRGAYGRPWLLGQVIEFLRTGVAPPDPPLDVISATVLAHFDEMLRYYGRETGMRMARKHIGWYSKGLPGSAEFRATVFRVTDAKNVRDMIRAFFDSLIDRAGIADAAA